MISEEKALQLAKKVLGDNFSRTNIGTNNWVYEKGDRIFSAPRVDWVKGYGIRVAAAQKLRAHGIPVPKIIEFSLKEPEYIIVEKVDGENVDLSKKTKPQRDKIHQSAGEILRAIHEIEGNGFGRVNEDLRGKHDSWIEYLDAYFAKILQNLRRDPEIFQIYGPIIEQQYQEMRPRALEMRNPRFLHGDYHFGNILFKNDLVTAVLDLDLVESGNPSWDTSYYYLHTFNADRQGGLEAFRRGYGPDIDPLAERLSSLAIWARKVSRQVVDRPEKLPQSIKKLDRILNEK